MSKIIAHIISFVFNPAILVALLPPILVFITTYDLYAAFLWGCYTIIFLVALGVFMVYAIKQGIFTDLDVSKREQRPLLFFVSIVTGMFYLAGLFFLHAPFVLFLSTYGIIIGIFIASIINKYIKASLHVATLTAIVVSLIFFYQGYYFFLLLLIPLVAWARLRIKRHTLQETIVGGIFGTLLSLGISTFVMFLFTY